MGLIQLGKKMLSTTWSNKPSASNMQGLIIRVSDIGRAGALFISNGTRWQPLGGSCVLSISQTSSSVTGTTSETNLVSVSVPGGLMSANGQLEIFTLWSYTNSATARNARIRFGADALTGTIYSNPSLSTTNTLQSYILIKNNGSTSSQYGFPNSTGSGYATSTGTLITSSIDTTVDFGLYFNFALGDSAHTGTLEGYSVTYVEG
ncbi:MAG: hypothetical protein AB7I27_00300 [Bacteriovoracaceae bacterium]